MATLDSRYIISPPLQEVFRDKDTGLPLRNGYVQFFRDTDRSAGKDVYKLDGTPGNYTYTSLGSTVTLTQNGTWSDGLGNDISIAYFPFLEVGGVEEIDRYFIRVFSVDDVEQFTREAWPRIGEESEDDDNFVNYIADGQFWNHRNLPNGGQVVQGASIISYGGGMITSPSSFSDTWSVNIPPSSTSNDTITFERFGSFSSVPGANPRYAARYKTTAPDASDTFKTFSYQISNVNFLSSDTEFLTFQFEANSNLTGPVVVEFIIQKNFGSGGSPGTNTPITSFTIQPGWGKYTVNFVMGDNSGKNLGATDDDILTPFLSLPTDQVIDLSLTNFILRDGSFQSLKYPEQTPRQNQSHTLTMPVPAHDLSDEGKVPVLGSSGFFYSGGVRPAVGDMKYTYATSPEPGWIFLTTDNESMAIASGATFNGEQYRDLYVLLHPLPEAVIGGGVKGDPNDDFDANLILIFPPMIGRVTGAAGQGSGLTLRTVGSNTGEENETISLSQMPSHNHVLGPGSGVHGSVDQGNSAGGLAVADTRDNVGLLQSGPGYSTSFVGSGAPLNIMQPTFFGNLSIYFGGI